MNSRLKIDGKLVSFASTGLGHFEELYDLGVEGSVPGAAALSNQKELYGRGEGVSVSIFFDGSLVGMVTLVETPWKGCLTTSTYVSPGNHSVHLSSLLKETAYSVAYGKHRGYVIFVSPDNEYAQMSMRNVWPMSTPEVTDDGTLAYQARHVPHSCDEELAVYFNRLG